MEVSVRATRDGRGFWKNLVTNIKGPAPSVVIIAWIIAVVIVTLSDKYIYAAAPLSMFITMYLMILGSRS